MLSIRGERAIKAIRVACKRYAPEVEILCLKNLAVARDAEALEIGNRFSAGGIDEQSLRDEIDRCISVTGDEYSQSRQFSIRRNTCATRAALQRNVKALLKLCVEKLRGEGRVERRLGIQANAMAVSEVNDVARQPIDKMRNAEPRIIDDGEFAVMIIHAGVAKKIWRACPGI